MCLSWCDVQRKDTLANKSSDCGTEDMTRESACHASKRDLRQLVRCHAPLIQHLEDGHRKMPGTSWPVILAKLVSSRFNKELHLPKQSGT